MLDEMFVSESKIMRAEIDKIRATLNHRGNKGSEAETILRTFLTKYLPRRLAIGHGEIIDRSLSRSRQTDIVVTNEHHPFTFSEDRPGIFFIEGVSAVGEVKMRLTTTELANSFAAARQYKSLAMILPAGATAYCSIADNKRYYVHPPYFLFAFESDLSLDTINDQIGTNIGDNYSPGESIDGIFVLDKGYFIDFGSGEESLKFISGPNFEPTKGWQGFSSEEVLIHMLGWLSCVMPWFSGGSPILAPYIVQFSSRAERVAHLNRLMQSPSQLDI